MSSKSLIPDRPIAYPPISLGLIGCGGIGQVLAQSVGQTGLARLAAVYDADPDRSAAAAGLFAAQDCASAAELLELPAVQAVLIAAPPFLHANLTCQAAAAGKSIFLEKPMALGIRDCARILTCARQAGVSLMVGHVLRYFEPFQTITGLAQSGRLGRCLRADVWRTEKDWIDLAPWKGRRAGSGGYLYEVGAHALDWIRQLLGEPLGVQARIHKQQPAPHEIEDEVSVEMTFSGGAAASFLGGAGFPLDSHGFALQFELANLHSNDAFSPEAVQIEWRGLGDAPRLSFDPRDPFERQLIDWLKSLRAGAPPPITGEDVARTVAVIEAAYRSAGW